VSGRAADTRRRGIRAVQLDVGGETRGGRLRFDLGVTCVVLVLRGPHLLTQAHPQVGNVREVKIHVEGVGSAGVIAVEELIQCRRTVSLRLLLAVCVRRKGKRLRGEVPVHLTLYLWMTTQTHKQKVWFRIFLRPESTPVK